MDTVDKNNKMYEILVNIKSSLPGFKTTRYTTDEGKPYDAVCPELLQLVIDKLVEELAVAKTELVMFQEKLKHSIIVIDTRDEEETFGDK